jgi:hypothetical protein
MYLQRDLLAVFDFVQTTSFLEMHASTKKITEEESLAKFSLLTWMDKCLRKMAVVFVAFLCFVI